MNLRSKMPTAWQTVEVFAVASMAIYGWTTYRFLQDLPGWLHYLHFGEILSTYAYTAVIDFLEALIFIGLILLVNLCLPRKLFFERFVARGSLLALLGGAYLIFLAVSVGSSKAFRFPEQLFLWSPAVLLAVLVAVLFLGRVELVRRAAEDLADRAVILLYIFVPLSALGLAVLVYNFIF